MREYTVVRVSSDVSVYDCCRGTYHRVDLYKVGQNACCTVVS